MPQKSKSKSIWRQPEAQHFQVVHRSQRDPLIHDPQAGQHVLKSFNNLNQSKSTTSSSSKAKTLSQLEQQDSSIHLGKDGKPLRQNVGQAALYGVYYDDTEYDYMQHLRPINDDFNSKKGGVDERDDTQAILLQAPTTKKNQRSTRGSGGGFDLKEQVGSSSHSSSPKTLQLPPSVLPSKKEVPFSYQSQLPIDPSLQGFQPDMDPHLRQVLEALDDEAFVDEELDEDDFFGQVVQGGEWDGRLDDQDDQGGTDWRQLPPEGEESIWLDPGQRAQLESGSSDLQGLDQSQLSLEARVALFKKAKEMERRMGGGGSENEEEEEEDDDDDELRSLPSRAPGSKAGTMYTVGGSVLGKKGRPGAMARRAANSMAGSVHGGGMTAFSMSSSAMFRNKGLTELDERFDKIEKDYGGEGLDEIREEEDDDDEDDDGFPSDRDEDQAEPPVSREDFENIMDEFLEKYEVYGGKLKQTLGGRDASGTEKLEILRRELGKARIEGKDWQGRGVDVGKGLEGEDLGEEEEEEEELPPMPEPRIIGSNREKWDVETVLTTRTNLENHPKKITARESVRGSSFNLRPSRLDSPPSSSSSQTNRPDQASTSTEERLPKIRINPRTGFPEIVGHTKIGRGKRKEVVVEEVVEEEEEEEEVEPTFTNVIDTSVGRDRKETKEEKKERKANVKAAKQERRNQKSIHKQQFAMEKRRQNRLESSRVEHLGTGSAPGGVNVIKLV
ncbi:LTV-domain-containing protein [Violaceomyces palustris]|uniref:LTV-domain-containing protein n=1 Tax=Violaceomyces palustris TaxID=1673888 RepID=A0ACD0NMF1_9BASI|nr:LTV-domain-containing protein [Violaceomyces palustris]